MTFLFLFWSQCGGSGKSVHHQLTSAPDSSVRGPLTEPNQRTGHLVRHFEAGVSPQHTRTWQLKHRGCHSPGHRMEPHFKRQACLARLGNKLVSPRALVRAMRNKLLRLLRPPTPDFDAQHDHACSAVVPHQLRVLALRSFRRRASHNGTPSIRSALRLAVPSERMALTRVASIANCAPPKRSRPSTTSSSLMASTTPG